MRQRLYILRLDRRAAPDAKAGRRIAIGANIIGDFFFFEQACERFRKGSLGIRRELGADVFQLQLIDDIGHPAFAKGFACEHIDAALAEQRPKVHFDRTGVRAGDDADAITGRNLQKLTGELDGELQPGLGDRRPVRAGDRRILEVLDLPARALGARSG